MDIRSSAIFVPTVFSKYVEVTVIKIITATARSLLDTMGRWIVARLVSSL